MKGLFKALVGFVPYLKCEVVNVDADGWPTTASSWFEGDVVSLNWLGSKWIIFVGKTWRKEL